MRYRLTFFDTVKDTDAHLPVSFSVSGTGSEET